jgi:hypothetical protein
MIQTVEGFEYPERERGPVHTALLDHLDHLLDHLLPQASSDGAAQIFTARVRRAFEAHDPAPRGLFDDQPSEP